MVEKLDVKADLLGVLRSPAISFAVCNWLDGHIKLAAPAASATYSGARAKFYVTLHPKILSRLDEKASSLGIQRSAAVSIALTNWLEAGNE